MDLFLKRCLNNILALCRYVLLFLNTSSFLLIVNLVLYTMSSVLDMQRVHVDMFRLQNLSQRKQQKHNIHPANTLLNFISPKRIFELI